MEYLLGMDGGGTATKICVSDVEGAVVARHTAGPLNINGQDPEQFQRTISEILQWLDASGFRPEDCGGIGIGAAGISNPQTRQLLTEAFREYRTAISTYSDGETALAAAFPECHGIILIAGTGSICLGRRENGEMVRAGGYGHLIDDGGSAYGIAIAILSAVVRAEDGRAGPTARRRLVCEKLGTGSLEELIGYLYAPSRSKKEIASLAVVLEKAAGDAAAMEIELKSAGELCLLVRTVMDRLPEENSIALAGSVLLKNHSIRDRVCGYILEQRRDSRIVLATQDASEGAVRLLKREKFYFSSGRLAAATD